jgi:hypothetical protein
MATKQSTITTTIVSPDDMGNTSLRLVFDNGQTIQLDPAIDLTPEMRHAAMIHGLKQKLVDAAAISRNTDTGRAASTDDKFNAVKEVYDRLIAGQWNKTREGGAGGAGAGGLLFRAVARMFPKKTPEQLREFLDAMDAKQQAALRKNPKVAAVIAEIRAESAKPGDDGDDLLAELEGGE